jgi:MinD-like ATPase involved in chromosome partitioning or flagellar assembly
VTRKIGFASVKGASGTTTGALGVAAASAVQGPVTFVEADPSGGSLLSWSDDLRPAGDLYDAAMSREPGGLAAIVQHLGDVAVVPSWGRPFRTTQALMRPRVPWDLLFDELAGTVIVDLGRLYPEAPTLGVLNAMDVIVLVSASEPGPVATTMEWAGRGGRHAAGDVGVSTDRIVMMTNEVVARRRRLSVTPREMASLQGPPYVGHFEHDETAVELLHRGASVLHRSLRRSPLVQSATNLAVLLADRAGLSLSTEGGAW